MSSSIKFGKLSKTVVSLRDNDQYKDPPANAGEVDVPEPYVVLSNELTKLIPGIREFDPKWARRIVRMAIEVRQTALNYQKELAAAAKKVERDAKTKETLTKKAAKLGLAVVEKAKPAGK